MQQVYLRMNYENDDEGIKLLQTSSAFQFVCSSLEMLKYYLRQKERTAKLWLSYIDYINVLKQFICTEHSGDWDLYIYSQGGC